MKVAPRNVAGCLRRAFSLKKIRNVRAVGRERFTITLNARRVLLRKHTESGRVGATRLFLEKRYGIRERLAASHVNLYSHVSRKTHFT